MLCRCGLACISYSLSPQNLATVVQRLKSIHAGAWKREIAQIDDVNVLTGFPLSAVERDNFQRDISLQFSGDRSISRFATPKPKHFEPIHPYDHKYIAQLSVVGDAPPKHFYLGNHIIEDHRLSTNEARVGKDGPAYFCPTVAYFGGDIDTVLVKPILHLPPLYEIVEQLARTQGYECRQSDKGIYADAGIAKWGGLEEIGTFLRNSQHRTLMDRFLDTSKSEPGKGVYLQDRRRYLEFAAIKAVVGDSASTLVDELITKQVLYRGFIFACSYCRNADWFSVSDITQEFECRRCGRSQVYLKRNWKMPDEPAWFYKLDELIYQGYRQGFAVSLLALKYLKAESRESFTFTTDREFWRPQALKPEVEADFFCVPDGVLTVGEAKTENSLSDGKNDENAKINKYEQLVKHLSVRRLVFATLSESWRKETVEKVRSAFADLPYVDLVFLDSSHLL
jgi:hypothetical protein